MTEVTDAPAFPVVSIKRDEVPIEGIYFEGGAENAKAVIEWVESLGHTATYVKNPNGLWEEFVRVRVENAAGTSNRFAIPGSWIVREPDGELYRLPKDIFEMGYSRAGDPSKEVSPDAWIELAASVCHEVNRELQIAFSDESPSPHWKSAPNWQKESALEGVVNALNGQTPKELHESWMQKKLDDGWVYGETKNGTTKTHPCIVPYENLDDDQRLKDTIFSTIVKTFKDQAFL